MPSRITILDETLDHSIGEPPPQRSQPSANLSVASRSRHGIEQSQYDEADESRREQRVRFASSHGAELAEKKATAATLLRRRNTNQLQAGLSPHERQEFFKDKDITSSKSLLGYAMNCVCSAVVLTASIMYRYSGTVATQTLLEGHVLMLSRIRAVIVLSCIGFASSGFIVICHFDSWLFPKVWARFFKKGSKMERALLVVLLLYWIFTLGISTGLYSIGQYQPNVFFGCWACLVSIFYAYDKWRDGAGKVPCLRWATDRAYETKMSLVGVAVSSGIVLLGGLDMFANYHIHRGKQYNQYYDKIFTTKLFIWIFTCPGISSLVTVAILLLRDDRFQVFGKEHGGDNNPPAWWNTLEGVAHLGLFSVWTYVAFTFTEGISPINAVDNMYFGSWLAFLFAMNGFGSWFKDYSFQGLCSQQCCRCCKKKTAEGAETDNHDEV